MIGGGDYASKRVVANQNVTNTNILGTFGAAIGQQHQVVGAQALASAVLCPGQDIAACQGDGNGFLLDGRRQIVTFFENAHQQFSLEIVILKLVAFGGGHVFSLQSGVSGGCAEMVFPVITGIGSDR